MIACKQFRVLLAAHRPTDAPEATLVMAAAAAFAGLRADGAAMPEAAPQVPTLRALADELGLSIGAVRRGMQALQAAGLLDAESMPRVEALRDRWVSRSGVVRLPAEVRALRLRAVPLLVAGYVAGQVNRRGQVAVGIPRLAARLGLASRTAERALATCRRARVVRSWVIPRSQQLVLACCAGTESEAQPTPPPRSHATPPPVSRATPPPLSHADELHASESGGEYVPKWRSVRAKAAASTCESGGRYPEPGSPDHPGHGVTRSSDRADGDAPPAHGSQVALPEVILAAVGQWVVDMVARGVEHMTPDVHAADVCLLLEVLGPRPRHVRDLQGFRTERLALARRVVRFSPSPEWLGRWLVRVSRWYEVQNLGAYLRRACERGDPATVLEGGTRRRLGRGAETLRDFSATTERALVGAHQADVEQLVRGGVAILTAVDDAERARLRTELSRCWHGKRSARWQRATARGFLRRLVGDRPTNAALAAAVAGIMTVAEAREVLAA